MSHFAQVIDGIVAQVIVAEQDFINSGAVGDPSQWIQTSYNTIGGTHRLGGTPLRKNYAGIGYTYNAELDAFIAPKPAGCSKWVLDEEKGWYKPPTPPGPMPDFIPATTETEGTKWAWDDENVRWAPESVPKLTSA
jgi:hypothetical protein